MSQNSKIGLGLVAVVILVLAFFWYPSYKIQNEQKAKLALSDKVYELDQLILKNHDCPKVVDEAKIYLQKNPGADQVWTKLGVCQFETEKFDDAKISFQNALALSPNNEGAQNYLKVLTPPRELKVEMENQVKYEKITGNTKQDYAPNLPPGFPSDLPLGKYESVADSHVETLKGDAKDKTAHKYVIFIYTTKDTQQNLADQFSNYLKANGYVLEMSKDESGKYVTLIAKKDTDMHFTITITNGDNEGEQLVSVNYSTIEPLTQ